MNIAVIKYNAGNIKSVGCALDRLNVRWVLTDNPEVILSADKVIFPGVGEASTTMAYLKEHKLDKVITSVAQPLLGICLGMQLLCSHSEEFDTECLGIFEEKVKKFPKGELKIPHMGWNGVSPQEGGIYGENPVEEYFYFVHSYYAECGPHTTGVTEYTLRFAASISKNNFHAVQFHPEKSAESGHRLISNFLEL